MDSNGDEKRFSKNFISLQLQLKTLLEEAGGDDLLPFLDTLACLNRSEQRIVLRMLTRTIERVVKGGMRFETDGDVALKAFEENLYTDVANAMEEAAKPIMARKRIEVIVGGKEHNPKDNAPIDLASARKKRKISSENLIN